MNDETLRRYFYWVFSSFSIITLLIWYSAIVRRGARKVKITWERVLEIEQELQLMYCFPRPLLYSRIRKKMEKQQMKAIYGVYAFIILAVIVWICVGLILLHTKWL